MKKGYSLKKKSSGGQDLHSKQYVFKAITEDGSYYALYQQLVGANQNMNNKSGTDTKLIINNKKHPVKINVYNDENIYSIAEIYPNTIAKIITSKSVLRDESEIAPRITRKSKNVVNVGKKRKNILKVYLYPVNDLEATNPLKLQRLRGQEFPPPPSISNLEKAADMVFLTNP